MSTLPVSEMRRRLREGGLFLAYFAAYLGYLFVAVETEIGHWLSLVALPLLLLIVLRRPRDAQQRRMLAASIGLDPGGWRRGLLWAIPLGLALGALQLLVSRHREGIVEVITSGRVLYLLPLLFGLMLLTAGFTEEFFFRGVLQTRLAALLRSRIAGVVVTSLAFGLFHWPYAYLVPHWPSHGDLGAAFQTAMLVGMIGGLILGTVYELSRRNLLACVVVHALINAVPGMTQVHFGRSTG